MTYHVFWETRDGDEYSDEVATLEEAVAVVQAMTGDATVTIRPPGWFDEPDEEDDDA